MNSGIGLDLIAFALLLIFFYGDPDMSDAIIHYLMTAAEATQGVQK